MTFGFVLPLVAALVAGLAAGPVQRRLPPELATRALLWTALGCATAVLWGLALMVVASAVQLPPVASMVGWCHHVLPDGGRLPPWLGAVVVAGVGIAGWRTVRVHRAYRRACRADGGCGQVEVLPSDVPTAYAVPGRRVGEGRVVVSRGLMDRLPDEEVAVVFAHERAHLSLGHHRYVHAGELAAAAIPLLRPLANQLRYATERWADEHAAAEVGDRRLVARSIARAALIRTESLAAPVLTMVGAHVTGRVEALLAEPVTRAGPTYHLVVAPAAGLITVLVASTVQLHHLVDLAMRVCPI